MREKWVGDLINAIGKMVLYYYKYLLQSSNLRMTRSVPLDLCRANRDLCSLQLIQLIFSSKCIKLYWFSCILNFKYHVALFNWSVQGLRAMELITNNLRALRSTHQLLWFKKLNFGHIRPVNLNKGTRLFVLLVFIY